MRKKNPTHFLIACAILLVVLILLYVSNQREGLRNFGNCRDNPAIKKKNKKGTNCYGWCPYENVYKKSKSGSECKMYSWGYCENIPDRPKLDAEGSNCQEDLSKIPYKMCPDNSALKASEGNTNCFGWCPTSAKQKRKVYNWPFGKCPPL